LGPIPNPQSPILEKYNQTAKLLSSYNLKKI
jgi:hypothetical protein